MGSRVCSAALATATALLALAGSPAAADERDRVELTGGRVLTGRVLLEGEEEVALLVGTRERLVARADVVAIESVARAHREILARFRDLPAVTVPALLELAEASAAARLPHERELFLWRVLLLDPQNDAANEALGHRRASRGWLLRVGNSWRTLAEAERARVQWRNAWVLRSEHWELRCNAGLEGTLDTLLELEFLYDAFYRRFQQELSLRELTEPMAAHVYASQGELPPISGTIGAWFDPLENRLMTYFDGSRPFALFHEGTHAVLHNVAVRSIGSRGALPAWLNEGWADYMEGVLEPLGKGRARFDPSRRKPRLARVLDAEEKPYGLHRVLNFGSDDFAASSRQGQKYAQSYALFLYMLDGEDGRYRAQFLEYLHEALAGKGQASTFRRMFRRELDTIESAHLGVR